LLYYIVSKKLASYRPFNTFYLSLINIYFGVIVNGGFYNGFGFTAIQFV